MEIIFEALSMFAPPSLFPPFMRVTGSLFAASKHEGHMPRVAGGFYQKNANE